MSPNPPRGSTPDSRPPDAAVTRAREAAGSLDLLMDMEMPVLVRFSSTKMSVRDLLALDTGATVEFRRAPDDPVDILVNGRVVARGHVVTVQGNYGVRVTEIASQRDSVVGEAGPVARTIKGN